MTSDENELSEACIKTLTVSIGHLHFFPLLSLALYSDDIIYIGIRYCEKGASSVHRNPIEVY